MRINKRIKFIRHPNGLMGRAARNVEQHFGCSFLIFGDDALTEKAADFKN